MGSCVQAGLMDPRMMGGRRVVIPGMRGFGGIPQPGPMTYNTPGYGHYNPIGYDPFVGGLGMGGMPTGGVGMGAVPMGATSYQHDPCCEEVLYGDYGRPAAGGMGGYIPMGFYSKA